MNIKLANIIFTVIKDLLDNAEIVFCLQGLANVFGQFLGIFQCATESDHTSMAKIIQGSAMVSIRSKYFSNLTLSQTNGIFGK